jgi:RHS repeat-associated protein
MKVNCGYDSLDRITSGVSTGITGAYTYDANGNMLTSTGSTALTVTVSPTSNRVTAIAGSINRSYFFDAAGNAGYSGATFAFNQRGRASSRATSAGTSIYIYNALGQFISRQGYAGTLYLVYDEAGHILGEYSPGGTLVWQETIWLGDIPVATIRPNGSSITLYYVHADHLGTPRKVTRASDNKLMWSYDPATFGTPASAANQNPAGGGTFLYNLRFQGQFYMAEDAGYRDNGFRRFDTWTSRYLQSDPIGLKGGVNTYGYVGSNPLTWSDRLGLKPGDKFPVVGGNPSSAIQAAAIDALNFIYQSISATKEYAGTIYCVNGSCIATDPNTNNHGDNVIPSYPLPEDGGYAGVMAYYHTHGKCDKGLGVGNDVFSPDDKDKADLHTPLAVPSFLETPGRIILRYDPDTIDPWHKRGSTTTIQSGCNCPTK